MISSCLLRAPDSDFGAGYLLQYVGNGSEMQQELLPLGIYKSSAYSVSRQERLVRRELLKLMRSSYEVLER